MASQPRQWHCGGQQKRKTSDGMAVHAYLHRKGGQTSNAEYWYERAGRRFRRTTLDEEWQALVEGLLSGTDAIG